MENKQNYPLIITKYLHICSTVHSYCKRIGFHQQFILGTFARQEFLQK